jgi:hypothetical protein
MFANVLNEIAALTLVSGASFLSVFDKSQLDALAYLFLRLHTRGIDVASVFWGLWLFPMGYLVYKSGFLPKIIGVLLIVACFGYVISSFGRILGYSVDIILYTSWGEVLLLLWLLIKGVDTEQWNQCALESA